MNIPQDTVEVRAVHSFDQASLERYLAAHVEGFEGPLAVRQFDGGQSNPTYYLADANREYVLRRKPPGRLQPSAHAVDREYRVITALRDTGVPVPRTYALCEDPEVIGTIFFVMEFVAGRIFRVPHMPDLSPAERGPIVRAMVETLAKLHQVDPGAVALEGFGRSGEYVNRQIARWSKIYRASETRHIPAMERLLEWLPENVPDKDETTVIHGDFRLGNLIVHPTEPKIVAVLDWELSTLGHPLADLAYNCLLYRLDAELSGMEQLDLVALGMPTEADCVDIYRNLTGRESIPDWEFYLAFSMFRLAAISQGIMGRVRDGTASAADADKHGDRAPLLAQAAWAIIA